MDIAIYFTVPTVCLQGCIMELEQMLRRFTIFITLLMSSMMYYRTDFNTEKIHNCSKILVNIDYGTIKTDMNSYLSNFIQFICLRKSNGIID
ncbi:hypothetical protein SNEBB_002533 [Seison nebaliae]|nr:hypothetical protein SNEBB_002533 [Seison nebaliae]